METKIHLSSALAYENQLIRQHKVEIRRFLTQQEYAHYEIKGILEYYDKKVDTGNITKVHTHAVEVFLEALCTGNIEKLYSNTTSKNFKNN